MAVTTESRIQFFAWCIHIIGASLREPHISGKDIANILCTWTTFTHGAAHTQYIVHNKGREESVNLSMLFPCTVTVQKLT